MPQDIRSEILSTPKGIYALILRKGRNFKKNRTTYRVMTTGMKDFRTSDRDKAEKVYDTRRKQITGA